MINFMQTIILNGQERTVGNAVSYNDLVPNRDHAYTVTYCGETKSGSMTAGDIIDVEPGMVFNVSLTSSA